MPDNYKLGVPGLFANSSATPDFPPESRQHAHELSRAGDRLLERRDLTAAADYYRQALALAPDLSTAHSGMGAIFLLQGDFVRAAECYRRVLSISPDEAEALCNLGNALFYNGTYDEGVQCFEQALAIDASHADAHLGLAFAFLCRGNFRQGWPLYEWRLQKKNMFSIDCQAPRWHGEALNGKRILLYGEQGLGDTLQFFRYVPLVAKRGGHVVLQVQPRLGRLLAGSRRGKEIVTKADLPTNIDYQCPLPSLPFIFETELATIPSHVPYLTLDANEVERWSNRVTSSGLRVGLSWAGDPRHIRDRHRSIPLESFQPLLQLRRASFFSLQRGDAASQIQDLPGGLAIVDLEAECNDFAETAAAIAVLDLIITVDTSIAHLAGALGKEVWILLSYVPDWRWLLEGDRSPWYPTARLFRQPGPGDWKAVIEQVSTELQRAVTVG